LGTQWAPEVLLRNARSDSTMNSQVTFSKQSFEDKCIPKLELGNEGIGISKEKSITTISTRTREQHQGAAVSSPPNQTKGGLETAAP
jgi:hypothetical protein